MGTYGDNGAGQPDNYNGGGSSSGGSSSGGSSSGGNSNTPVDGDSDFIGPPAPDNSSGNNNNGSNNSYTGGSSYSGGSGGGHAPYAPIDHDMSGDLTINGHTIDKDKITTGYHHGSSGGGGSRSSLPSEGDAAFIGALQSDDPIYSTSNKSSAGKPDKPGEAQAKMIAAGVMKPSGEMKQITGYYKDPNTGTLKFIAKDEYAPIFKSYIEKDIINDNDKIDLKQKAALEIYRETGLIPNMDNMGFTSGTAWQPSTFDQMPTDVKEPNYFTKQLNKWNAKISSIIPSRSFYSDLGKPVRDRFNLSEPRILKIPLSFIHGSYDKIQSEPVSMIGKTAIFAVGTKGLGAGVSKLASSSSVGSVLAAKGVPVVGAGIGVAYGGSVVKRINDPYQLTTQYHYPNMPFPISETSMIEKTASQKARIAGEIFTGEIIPMGIGGHLGTLKLPKTNIAKQTSIQIKKIKTIDINKQMDITKRLIDKQFSKTLPKYKSKYVDVKVVKKSNRRVSTEPSFKVTKQKDLITQAADRTDKLIANSNPQFKYKSKTDVFKYKPKGKSSKFKSHVFKLKSIKASKNIVSKKTKDYGESTLKYRLGKVDTVNIKDIPIGDKSPFTVYIKPKSKKNIFKESVNKFTGDTINIINKNIKSGQTMQTGKSKLQYKLRENIKAKTKDVSKMKQSVKAKDKNRIMADISAQAQHVKNIQIDSQKQFNKQIDKSKSFVKEKQKDKVKYMPASKTKQGVKDVSIQSQKQKQTQAQKGKYAVYQPLITDLKVTPKIKETIIIKPMALLGKKKQKRKIKNKVTRTKKQDIVNPIGTVSQFMFKVMK